jgi:hypothetical protein
MHWSNNTHWLTHTGPCGGCSGTQDLEVYFETENLTHDARTCALMSLVSTSFARACLHKIGFTDSCVHAWLKNIQLTISQCFRTCIIEWFSPLKETNPCIACDERVSGQLFLELAGRTRRNSGLVSEIDRTRQTSKTDNQKILTYLKKYS